MDQLQAIKIRANRKAETEIRNQMDTIVVCLAKALFTDVTRIILVPKLNEFQRKGLLTQT